MNNEFKRIADMSPQEFKEYFPSHTASASELAWEAGFFVVEKALFAAAIVGVPLIGYKALKEINGQN